MASVRINVTAASLYHLSISELGKALSLLPVCGAALTFAITLQTLNPKPSIKK